MEGRPPGDVLLDHLERDLGEFRGRGLAEPETSLDFSLFQFDDRPEDGVTTTVTFGISTHVLTGRDGSERRQELLLALRADLDDAALDIAANIGAYVVDRHVALLEGETMRTPTEEDLKVDMLVAATPAPFPSRLSVCPEFEPPVEIVWLLPFAESEHHIVAEHGWRDLLHWLRERRLDVYDLARETVL